MRRLARLAAAVAVALTAFTAIGVGIEQHTPAGADPGTACKQESDTPGLNFPHGNPLTGISPPSGYYYLGVRSGAACPVGSTVTLAATIRVTSMTSAAGPPPPRGRMQQWFALFHRGTSATGTGFGLSNDPANVHILWNTATTTPCHPPTNSAPQLCLNAPGDHTIVLIYHGPDVWNLAHGGTAGFRIDNMATDRQTVCDYAALWIVV
jgi:hypothetical protein